MNSNESAQEILQTALEWLDQNHTVGLVTVVKTWGSSPSPAGSMMLLRDDGQYLGSVSGGCIEDDILVRYCGGEFIQKPPSKLKYGVTSEQAHRFSLPCGGGLELVLENLINQDLLRKILAKINQDELICRRLCLVSGEVTLLSASYDDKFSYTDSYIQQVFGPNWQLLLIGAGHLSHCVMQIGLMLGYQVTVCDPREKHDDNWQLSESNLTKLMPDDAVKKIATHKHSIVITLTHDPKLDDMALWEALQFPIFYIGALGSKRTNAARRQRLQQLGLSPEQLARLHGPVGIPIGSHTPAEIAVAIMADITAARHGITLNVQ
ncbi:MAG: XdhC family protein [Candidatus Marithrix sp.]